MGGLELRPSLQDFRRWLTDLEVTLDLTAFFDGELLGAKGSRGASRLQQSQRSRLDLAAKPAPDHDLGRLDLRVDIRALGDSNASSRFHFPSKAALKGHVLSLELTVEVGLQ